MVHSVINLVKQTQGTDLPSVPQTTKFTLAHFRTANNPNQQTQMKLRTRHPHVVTILQAEQILCIETARAHMDN